MTQITKRQLYASAVVALGLSLVGEGVVFAQTKQLKELNNAPKVATQSQEPSSSYNTLNLNPQDRNSSYSVVIENHTTPDGKVIQSKKVWSNGNLIQEEEKELDPVEANNSFNATIQLPNGQVAPGGVFQSEDGEDIFGSALSPFDVIRKMEEQMRTQEERMRAQFDALRNRIANGQNLSGSSLQNSQVLPSGTLSKYWLGLTIVTIPEILTSQLPIEENEGVLLQYVVPGSPADKIGLKRYDVLHSVNDKVIATPVELTKLVEELGAQKVKVGYFRKGKLETAEIEIAERPQTLGSQLNLNAPIQNKQFQVVRPGLIVPSEELDKSAEKTDASSEAKTVSPSATNAEVQPSPDDAHLEQKAE